MGSGKPCGKAGSLPSGDLTKPAAYENWATRTVGGTHDITLHDAIMNMLEDIDGITPVPSRNSIYADMRLTLMPSSHPKAGAESDQPDLGKGGDKDYCVAMWPAGKRGARPPLCARSTCLPACSVSSIYLSVYSLCLPAHPPARLPVLHVCVPVGGTFI